MCQEWQEDNRVVEVRMGGVLKEANTACVETVQQAAR